MPQPTPEAGVTEHVPLHTKLLRRFRVRGVRDLRDLDARDRLGYPPRPLVLALAIFFLIALLGVIAFALGRSTGTPWILLLVAAIAVSGMAVAVGSALAVAEYRALEQADSARAELLALQAELEVAHREASARLHDARAMTAAMGAALHALERSGADHTVVGALSDQLTHLRSLLTAPPAAKLEPVSLAEVLVQVESFAALHGVTLLRETTDDAVVLANRERMVAVLQNLVDNARKYAPGSPVLVTWEPAGPYLKIVVQDEGPGIAPADAETLFLPGVRHGEDAQGFGLGLAIARGLAESMQGTLWYESRAGRGSRFVLKLPRASEATTNPPAETP